MKKVKAQKAKFVSPETIAAKWPHPAIKQEYLYRHQWVVIGETADRRFYVTDWDAVTFTNSKKDAYRLYNLFVLKYALEDVQNVNDDCVTGTKTGCENICALIERSYDDTLIGLIRGGAQYLEHGAWPGNPYDMHARANGKIANPQLV